MVSSSTVAMNRPARWVLVLAWLLFAAVWFGSLGVRSLITPDEGRYATLSLGMLWSGDWLTPRLNGTLYFEKPALQYWAGALAYQLFGVNEFAARFWPGLAGFASVAAVAYTGARLWGREAGLSAALLAGSMLWVYANSHYLTLDAGLMGFLTLALCGFLLAQRDGATPAEQRHFMWLTWAAMAGATLSKGLVGLVIPGATLFLYSVVNWQWAFWRRMYWVAGLLIFFALAAPWFVAVSLRNPGFFDFFFIHEHFTRFTTNEHRREGSLWFFVPLLLAGLLPWTALLPAMLAQGWRRAQEGFQPGRLLLVWSGFVFVFFSVSGSKLPSYILPMFPALALLGAAYVVRTDAARLRKFVALPLLLAVAVLGYIALGGGAGSASLPPEVRATMVRALALGMALMLLASAAGFWLLGRGRRLAGIACVALGGLLAAVAGTSGHEAYGIEFKSARRLAAELRPQIAPDTPVYTLRDYDQTLPFYLGRPVTLVDYVDEFEFGQKQEPGRAVPTLDEFAARWREHPRAAASMPIELWPEMQARGLAMKPVYQDRKRIAVIKP